jgi:hypothetical protein
MASSARLLKLLPNDGPRCDLNSIAATSKPPRTTQHVPALGGAEVARQRQLALRYDEAVVKAIVDQDVAHHRGEAVHLPPARHRGAAASVGAARPLPLALLLQRLPVVRDGVARLLVEVAEDQAHPGTLPRLHPVVAFLASTVVTCPLRETTHRRRRVRTSDAVTRTKPVPRSVRSHTTVSAPTSRAARRRASGASSRARAS